MNLNIKVIKELYKPDFTHIEQAKRRQAAFWRREKTDKCPIILGADLSPAQEKIPSPNYKEAFYNKDFMFCGQLRGACSIANAMADGVPSARGNYGTGILLACLGLEQNVFDDKMPWLQSHLSKNDVAKLEPDTIEPRGTFAEGLEYMRYHKRIMGETLPLYCMDTQGPFDLAHLILGDEIFYVAYDDPSFMHHLMELCLQLGIKAHEWMKEISGEPLFQQYHSNSLYAENMGIRICEDTTAIVGPDIIHEFAMPYTKRLAAHFGGAWVHYCGKNDVLTDALLEIPEIRGINFGHVPGREYDHVFETEMEKCALKEKIYFGGWPRLPGEKDKQYLRRLHRWAKNGVLIPHGNTAIGDELKNAEAVRDYWYSLG